MAAKTSWITILLGCSLLATACSSSPSEEFGDDELAMGDGMALGDELPELEANTDDLPLGDLEEPSLEGGFAEGGELDESLSLEDEPLFAEEGAPAGEDPFAADTMSGEDPFATAAADDPFASESADPVPTPVPLPPEPSGEFAAETPTFDDSMDNSVAQPEPALAAGDMNSDPFASQDSYSSGFSDSSATSGSMGSGEYEDYQIASGDTLMKIAFETYGDLYKWRKIYEDNQDKISNPNSLEAGTVLKLEKPSEAVAISRNGERYLIKEGDTLGRIADDVYGSSSKWRKIWENNRQLIKDPNKIFAGFYLYYTITPEERDEADRLRMMKQEAQPLAEVTEEPARFPATETETASSALGEPVSDPLGGGAEVPVSPPSDPGTVDPASPQTGVSLPGGA